MALCGIVQYINLIGAGVGYTITGSIALVAFKRSDCFHQNPGQSTADDGDPGCTTSNTPWCALGTNMVSLFICWFETAKGPGNTWVDHNWRFHRLAKLRGKAQWRSMSLVNARCKSRGSLVAKGTIMEDK